jgi:hypothetical protein
MEGIGLRGVSEVFFGDTHKIVLGSVKSESQPRKLNSAGILPTLSTLAESDRVTGKGKFVSTEFGCPHEATKFAAAKDAFWSELGV